jgi:Carboxypeptidase regulatory-like domain
MYSSRNVRSAHGWAATAGLVLGIAVGVGACRQGVPVIDPGPKPAEAAGTISGTVRGPEGTSSITGRQVEVINVETNERQTATTNNAGGFTFKVKPGKYRVQVTLLDGESIIKQPGIMNVNRSDVDAHADFIIGNVKLSRPRLPAQQGQDGLGPPIA